MPEGNDGVPVSDAPTVGQNGHWNHVARRLYEPERDGELTTAVAFVVADAEGIDPTDLETPLYDVIDVEGIEQAFFGSRTNETARDGAESVEFRYAGYLVNVRSDGWIHVYEPIDPDRL